MENMETVEVKQVETKVEKIKQPSLTAKQKLQKRIEALATKKAEEAEKKRLAEIARKEKAAAEEKAISDQMKDLEIKENVFLGKWLRDAYAAGFTHETMKQLKEKTKLLIEDGIK